MDGRIDILLVKPTSLACYSDRPGPPPLLIGATAAALSGRHCSCKSAVQVVCMCGCGLFQAFSGPTWRCLAVTRGLLGGLPPNLNTPDAQKPLGNLKISPPFAAPSSGAAEQLCPKAGAVVFPIACWAQELDALAAIFRLLWHCCPVVSCPCGPVGAGISPACCRMHWLQLGARRHDGHKWIASSACTSTIHLPCLPVCLVILLLASLKSPFPCFLPSQSSGAP